MIFQNQDYEFFCSLLAEQHEQIYLAWRTNEFKMYAGKLHEIVEVSFYHTLEDYLEVILGSEDARYFYSAFKSRDDAIEFVASITNSFIYRINSEDLCAAKVEICNIAMRRRNKLPIDNRT
jgi:hypothetical protein